MIPLNRIEQLNNFTDDLQRDTALSNLRAMQALQQGIPSLMMGMEPMQTPMLNMNEGGLVSLPVVHKLFGGGFNPFKPIRRAARSIGRGISNIGKSVGKGLSGIFKGLTGGGNMGDMLKTMALMSAFSMMGPIGGMNPHVWRMLYGGLTPGLARGKLKFDPMSAAMTVGGGYLGDKLFKPPVPGAVQGPPVAGPNPLDKFINPGTTNVASLPGYGPNMGNVTMSGTPSSMSYANIPTPSGLGQMPPMSEIASIRDGATFNYADPLKPSRNLFQRNIVDPMGQGLDYVRDVANLEIPGAETLKDLGQTDVGFKSLNDLYPGEYEIFKSDMLFPDAAPNVGRAVAGAAGGIEASQIYNEQAKAEQDYNDWMADQEAAAERAGMPTREWLKRIVDDPVKFTYNYKGPLSYEELINRYTQGAGDTETAQMFDPATFLTESGRDSGMYGLGQGFDASARYGGYLPEIKKIFGGGTSVATPQKPITAISLGGVMPTRGGFSTGGFGGLGGLINNPEILKLFNPSKIERFSMQNRPVQQEGKFQPMPTTDNIGETGPRVETSGIARVRQPSPFEKKGLMSNEEMNTYDTNMTLLLEENEKAVARKEPEFTVMGETFKTNPNGAPIPVGAQGPTLALAGGGMPSQFFSGKVPNTTDPRSDGMSDSETMLITDPTGKDPRGIMKISEQEYVMSAPDMAILGNGDPNAGAQLLDNFRQNLRQAAYGTRAHQPRIDPNKALSSLAHKAFG